MDRFSLEDEDSVFNGLERLRFISCRSCMRYTPFLFYLPYNEAANNPLRFWKEYLIVCASCLPSPVSLREMYPALEKSAACNLELVEKLKGFEYRNPYYRKYATFCRVIITLEVPDGLKPTSNSLNELMGLFPQVHLLENNKFDGLEEIGRLILEKVEQIRQHYSATAVQTIHREPEPEQPQCEPPVLIAECPMQRELETTQVNPYTDHLPRELDFLIAETPRSKPYIAGESRFKLKVLNSKAEYACDICLLSEKDNIAYGDFIEKQHQMRFNSQTPAQSQKGLTLRCHYFCLLSGSFIYQRGQDSSGILGFLLKDVYNSFSRYRATICCYCGQPSAPINCRKDGCSRHFHYICGYKNNCVTQFTDQFKSFCHEHLPDQNKPDREGFTQCWICWDELEGDNGPSIVYSNCKDCNVKTAWYHRYCLQRFALEAGYYFKCPCCFDKDFAEPARLQGVFVPTRDASWELEKGAYDDIHNSKCCDPACQLQNSGKPQQGILIGCKACGGETIHKSCAAVEEADDYVCSKCMDATFIKLF